ncbi:MAG: HEAT repeat domain-containing protein [Pirellulales bacterium]|nr:HEAT repeat domain-containing protein [Pirellulales bacterium]
MNVLRPGRGAGPMPVASLVALLLLGMSAGCLRRSPTEPVSTGYPTAEAIREVRHRFDLAMAPPEAAPALTSATTQPLPLVREATLGEAAADALARIGPTAVPALVEALHDPQPRVRELAALALARMGPEAAKSVPELIQALQDADLEVQRSATRALGQIGPDAESAIPALMEVIRRDAQ